MKDLHSRHDIAQEADYNRIFSLLDPMIKSLLERELANNNLLAAQANQGWIAWLNTKQLVLAMLRGKLNAEQAIDAMELAQHVHRSGYTLADMHRWVDMLVAADEEERERLQIVEHQPAAVAA